MTEQGWNDAIEPLDLHEYLFRTHPPSERKIRVYAVATLRRAWTAIRSVPWRVDDMGGSPRTAEGEFVRCGIFTQ